MNVIDHKTDIFGICKDPYMTMTVKESSKEPERFKGRSNLYWVLKEGGVSGSFKAEFNNALISGEFNEVPKHTSPNDLILHKEGEGRNSNWSIDTPFANVSGTLETHEGIRTLSGFLYQDRQWGSMPIQDWVKDWIWTHIANNNLFVLSYCINSVDGRNFRYLMQGTMHGVSVRKDPETPYFQDLIDSDYLDSELINAKIGVPKKLSAEFVLSPENIMRFRIEKSHQNFSASYVRWSVVSDTNTFGEPLYGVSEYMRIRKHDKGK